MSRRYSVPLFVALVGAAGVTVTAVSLTHSLRPAPGITWLSIAVLAAALLLGEWMPVTVRHGKRKITVTFSTGFGYALVLLAPLGVAISIQIVAILTDDIRLGRRWDRVLFNASQWAITYAASSAVFVSIAHRTTLSQQALSWREIGAIVAAGLTYVAVNHGLVNIVIALSTGRRPGWPSFDRDAGLGLPYAMELALAPTSIALLHLSPWLMPLLVLPAAVMHRSGKLAALREVEALRDSLTGLPNRASLYVLFDDVKGHLDEGSEELAVMLVDLDHFKEINDTLGHRVGDLLLGQVALRLASVLREGDTVARLGGDEFAIVARLGPSYALGEAEGLAERLRLVLHEPFSASGVRIDVQGSVGIALSPRDGMSMDLLLSRADIALYKAKEERGSAVFYSEEQDQHTPERLSLLGELREGIDRGELTLHYQPKVDVATNAVLGVEALVRWEHPSKGLLGPYQFIPLAENTGLIIPMTMTVLDRALAQTRAWMDRGWMLGMSINLSMRHLMDLELPDQIADALGRHDVPANRLTVEVTESTIMGDPARSSVVIKRIRALGVKIAIDDYGTGYSSLAYLRQLEIDELKIDQSFVSRLTGPGNDEVIIRSTIDLAHNLGLAVVAEGVESVDTYRRLGELQCDVVQGFLVARPMPAAEFDAWLTDPQVSFHLPAGAPAEGKLSV